MRYDTEFYGGFLESPGWADLFAQSDRILEGHLALAGHPAVVDIKSKGRIDYQGHCCDRLLDDLLPIERTSARTCQICGAPGRAVLFQVTCETHGPPPRAARRSP